VVVCTDDTGRRLGQGAFGIVVRAIAYGIRDANSSTVVAVKMAKGNLNSLPEQIVQIY